MKRNQRDEVIQDGFGAVVMAKASRAQRRRRKLSDKRRKRKESA